MSRVSPATSLGEDQLDTMSHDGPKSYTLFGLLVETLLAQRVSTFQSNFLELIVDYLDAFLSCLFSVELHLKMQHGMLTILQHPQGQ